MVTMRNHQGMTGLRRGRMATSNTRRGTYSEVMISNSRLHLTSFRLEGQISVELAKAAVTEVFENLKKEDFSKVK